MLVIETQSVRTLEVQVPDEVRLITLFDVIKVEFWRVGFMMSFPPSTNTFSSVKVVSSNSPLLERYVSTVQMRKEVVRGSSLPKAANFSFFCPDIGVQTAREIFT